jgi:hypothetical protein
MTPLGPGEVRARRRPFVILGVAALRMTTAFCLALPFQSLIADTGVGLRTEGDRALFEDGGYLLLEVLRLRGPELGAVAYGLLPLLSLALLLGAVANAALFVALNFGGRLALGEWLTRALRHVPGLLLLGIGTAFAQLFVFGVTAASAGAMPDSMSSPLATSAGRVSVWLCGAALAGALGGVGDVAKACLVRHDVSVVSALRQAGNCLRQRPLPACFGWLPFALCLVAAIVIGAQLSEALDVSRAGAWRVALVFALHQAVVVLAVALRAAWYARALRLAATASGPSKRLASLAAMARPGSAVAASSDA